MKATFRLRRRWFLILALAFLSCVGNLNEKLIRAAEDGRLEDVRHLLAKGADINATDSAGWTPYLAAASRGQWQVMLVLKAAGAKTDPGF
jgi:ankyrin repeat protein